MADRTERLSSLLVNSCALCRHQFWCLRAGVGKLYYDQTFRQMSEARDGLQAGIGEASSAL